MTGDDFNQAEIIAVVYETATRINGEGEAGDHPEPAICPGAGPELGSGLRLLVKQSEEDKNERSWHTPCRYSAQSGQRRAVNVAQTNNEVFEGTAVVHDDSGGV